MDIKKKTKVEFPKKQDVKAPNISIQKPTVKRGEKATLYTEREIEQTNISLAHSVIDTLTKHYPGHQWLVNVSIQDGICNIINAALSANEGMTVLIKDFINDPHHKMIKNLGGELLERYNQPRGMIHKQSILEMPLDFTGNPISAYDS